MTEANVRDTKDRILDTAERLFASQGIDATSLRQITSGAEVNLAAVNYHFQSKDELVRNVYERRLRPANALRIARLDALEAIHSPNPVPLEETLAAFYEPIINMAQELKQEGFAIGQIFGRIYTEPNAVVNQVWVQEMTETFNRFSVALFRSLPHLAPQETIWRMVFTIGVLAHTLGSEAKMERLSEGRCNLRDTDVVLRQMVTYAKAGLLAPSLEQTQ